MIICGPSSLMVSLRDTGGILEGGNEFSGPILNECNRLITTVNFRLARDTGKIIEHSAASRLVATVIPCVQLATLTSSTFCRNSTSAMSRDPDTTQRGEGNVSCVLSKRGQPTRQRRDTVPRWRQGWFSSIGQTARGIALKRTMEEQYEFRG